MPLIRKLSESLKNKIAAGEVVERPASVVRELVENSIDAGAGSIEVEIKSGGTRLIGVADDGIGMDAEDVRLSLGRHSTSKLHSEEELFNITSMGFRGEALPSIASVSRLRITSGLRGEAIGVELESDGGETPEVREAPARGTTVEVRDLFFNTPARKKFLKRESTELVNVIDAFSRLALSHPRIRFTLTADGVETVNLPAAATHRERIHQIYGSDFVEGLIEFSALGPGMELEGFVSEPGNFRGSRTHHFLFVNRRPVRDPSVTHAVYAALEGILPKEMHPIFFIYLQIDPEKVDVNVHPQKREVRFEDKAGLYRMVRTSVSGAIRDRRPLPEGEGTGEHLQASPGGAGYVGDGTYGFTGGVPGGVHETGPLGFSTGIQYIHLGGPFVALAQDGGLTVVDLHAAHERVRYEALLGGLEAESEKLLFPQQARLSPKEHLTVLENSEMLLEFGMEIEDFGGATVLVRSLPAGLEGADLSGVLGEAAEEMLKGGRPGRSLRESVAARMACHSSVRGTTVLAPEQLAALMKDLDGADDPEHCPHGRPTRVRFDARALRKLFKRA